MIPDKIYAKVVADILYANREPKELFGEPYQEYIRKNALLEWAKEEMTAIKNYGGEGNAFDRGMYIALEAFVYKINSL